MMLRFRARGGLMVSHYGADQPHDSIARYVGRSYDASYRDPKSGVDGGWPALTGGEEINVDRMHMAEYTRECNEGALWPGDAETASALGVKFDPKFGGEFPVSSPVGTKASELPK